MAARRPIATAAIVAMACSGASAFLSAPAGLGLRSSARLMSASRVMARGRLSNLRMVDPAEQAERAGISFGRTAVLDRAQDVGIGQEEERKAAEKLMQPCPLTQWGPELDILAEKKKVASMDLPAFPYEMSNPSLVGDEAQEAYFIKNKDAILGKLREHGAVVVRGFDITKQPEGFERMWKALGMEACLDPLHTVAGRPVVSGKNAIYEAVNKPSRAKFHVGMHNEMVGKRTVRRAAFVCFKAADEGGEFLVCDGVRVLRDLDDNFLQRLYSKKIRFSSAQLPMSFMDQTGPLQPLLEPVVKAVLGSIVDIKVDFDVEMFWNRVNGQRVIQAHAPPQPPVILHPETGIATWFCNIHSHSAKLRDDRDGVLPETTGSSQLNKSDVFYGDGEAISDADLEHVDKVTRKNTVKIAMQPGDVVLVDNYRAMHGRETFEGVRKHAVTWFK